MLLHLLINYKFIFVLTNLTLGLLKCKVKMLSINRYMAEWIESWDLEAMTSYNREIGVHSPVGASKLEFFHPGFIPTVFLWLKASQRN